jgi:Siphovirus Gp157
MLDTKEDSSLQNLSVAVQAHRNLVEQIKQAFPEADEETISGSAESATELDAAIIAVLRAALERESQANALSEMIEAMTARKQRLKGGAETMRNACLRAMLEVGWKRLPANPPDMTVSVGNSKPKVLITDENALPMDLCIAEWRPDKKAIGEALSGGRDVPGATLGNAEPCLRISRR